MPHFRASAQLKVNKFANTEWMYRLMYSIMEEDLKAHSYRSIYFCVPCLCNAKEAFFSLPLCMLMLMLCCCCVVGRCSIRLPGMSIFPIATPKNSDKKKMLGKSVVFIRIFRGGFGVINISHKIARSIEIAEYFGNGNCMQYLMFK